MKYNLINNYIQMSIPSNIDLVSTAIDTIYYMGTKFVLHHLDVMDVHQVNIKDVATFAVIDGVYHIFLKGNTTFAYNFTNSGEFNYQFSKYAVLILGVLGANALMKRDRMIDNMISIGASGVVSSLVDKLRGQVGPSHR